MEVPYSPALEPICEGLKTLFEPPPESGDFARLIDALDDAYVRGDLFGDPNQ